MKFKNIDNFVPGRFEKMGMLKGKRWYSNPPSSEERKVGLFKPQRHEFGNRKVFCANHYGEFMGYIVATLSKTKACPVELAHLTKYYENIHKQRNRATPQEKDGCIIYSKIKQNQELEHGEQIVDFFRNNNEEGYKELIERDQTYKEKSENLEICLAAIEHRTRVFYKDRPQEEIQEKVEQNKSLAIQMMIYDCMYGNNDRHSENWAMVKDKYGQDISLYDLYDNERVFGLYENQNIIEEALKTQRVKEVSEERLFSRLYVPGETKKYSSYKDVLMYLMKNYREETQSILKQHLELCKPEIIQNYIKKCEGLPSCYIDFQRIMYQERYNFAKDLYINNNLCKTKDENDLVK